ncbi:MAG: hypothetical protein K9N35_00625 [Candidatus Marinimicrobia bacterium]|nr:hypothetical protein [Candidatus Neomarinimicrobiota bacterium]
MELRTRLENQLGSEFTIFENALNSEPPISIRYNPRKKLRVNSDYDRVPWCSDGYYLQSRPNFTKDPLFHAGTYYVQEASSMFISYLIRETIELEEDIRVLDLSAAPGGKSTLIQSLITTNSLLVANEIIGSRNRTLRQNLARWGGDNHIVTQSDPRFFAKLPNYFDLILVDAPCSGEGMLRKDPAALQAWSGYNVAMCASRQKRILADIIPSLAPGGVLIYSTCTFSEEENEKNMLWLLEESKLELLEVPVPENWGILGQKEGLPGYRFYPHRLRGEGFFIAAFRKPGESIVKGKDRQASGMKSRFESSTSEDSRWISSPDRYMYLMRELNRLAIPKTIAADYQRISSALRITAIGLNMGKLYPRGLKPSPELALSQYVSPDVKRLELDHERSLDFLAHLNIKIPEKTAAGRYLVCHQGYGLGWLHKLSSGQPRNNYPTAWRILKR